jgi:hypothetical protein
MFIVIIIFSDWKFLFILFYIIFGIHYFEQFMGGFGFFLKKKFNTCFFFFLEEKNYARPKGLGYSEFT